MRRPALDHFAYALSSAADHSLLWHTIGAWRAVRAGSLRPAIRLSGALAIESLITNVGVKSLFGRVRPARRLVHSIQEPASDRLPYGMHVPITTSFPSGHATSAFCAATLIVYDDGQPASTAWFLVAAAVAASRVYVRMHHASDVIAGAALGVGLGVALGGARRRFG